MHVYAGLLTYFIPCYVYGKTAETLGESCLAHALTFLFHPLAWYCMANTRSRIREKQGIDVSEVVYICTLSGMHAHAVIMLFLFTAGHVVE